MTAPWEWTSDRLAVLKRTVADRRSAWEAAQELGCSRDAAKSRARKLGLRFNADRKRTAPNWPGRYHPKADERDERRRLASLERDWGLHP